MSPHDKTVLEETPSTTSNNNDATTTSPKVEATREMCYHCFDTLIETLRHKNTQQQQQHKKKKRLRSRLHDNHGSHNNHTTSSSVIATTFISSSIDPSLECPLFVTWETQQQRRRSNDDGGGSSSSSTWQLRGCIGTLTPRRLAVSISEYARLSAFSDQRFAPMTIRELSSSTTPLLRVAVSLLVNYERCHHVYDWTVGIHGIMIRFVINNRQTYSATYLPEVAAEQDWTVEETVASLCRKAGYRGVITSTLLETMECTRYQSSKMRVTYDEYVQEHCWQGRDPMLDLVALLSSPLAGNNNDNNDEGVAPSSHKSSWFPCYQL